MIGRESCFDTLSMSVIVLSVSSLYISPRENIFQCRSEGTVTYNRVEGFMTSSFILTRNNWMENDMGNNRIFAPRLAGFIPVISFQILREKKKSMK